MGIARICEGPLIIIIFDITRPEILESRDVCFYINIFYYRPLRLPILNLKATDAAKWSIISVTYHAIAISSSTFSSSVSLMKALMERPDCRASMAI